MEIKELLEKINDAYRRESQDDHLSDKERAQLVKDYLDVFRTDEYIMEDFPLTKSITEQFIHIVYDV